MHILKVFFVGSVRVCTQINVQNFVFAVLNRGQNVHITPTKRRRMIKYGSITKCLMQGKCM